MIKTERDRKTEKLEIRFYCGYKGEELPRSILIDNREFKIEEILWRERVLDHKSGKIKEVFKCKIEGEIVKIRRDECGEWGVSFSKDSTVLPKN